MKKDKLDVGFKIIKLLIVFFLFYFSAFFQYIPVLLFNIHNVTPKIRVLLNLFSNLCLVIIFFFMYKDDLRKEWKIFKKDPWGKINIGLTCWAIGIVIMIISNLVINRIVGGGASNEEAVQAMIKAMPLVMLINAGFIAPFSEEMVFRKSFRDVLKKRWVFAICSGAIFGLLHCLGGPLIEYLYIIPYGILGFSFALAYDKTDSVFTPLFLHMFHNTALILVSILRNLL